MTPTTTLLECPEEFEHIGEVMSNFDHQIDSDVAEKLATGPYYADYPGWNFHGRVWWHAPGNCFACRVMCYGTRVATIAGTLEEIMAECCARWGSQ